ncbi:MAG: hypothetical protein AUK54_01680 [Helicobacteraceae bacterium CG2_30_36_10]|nr:MAG: hypothetical protein AUK54_01680 [Helicobacteraceae bacterium CG2_30_36_10]
MNFLWFKIFSILIITYSYVSANVQLIKQENQDSNTTLLVIGGIHGDEPGGYFAASILATHYNITSKNLWIVPNLNQSSIQADKRGINGDMNRKFAVIKKDDKDANTIKEIKKIITSKKVSLVLNLHDGHGFYRAENHGKIFNPNAWGQTCVIDQCTLNPNQLFGNLNDIASTVKDNLNKKLLQEHHGFNVKNTKTKFDDEAMQLSLTYFAVTNNKPAFAIESSKHLSSLSEKVFYQLLAIEEFMTIMQISFTRDFELNIDMLDNLLTNYGFLEINNNILFNLSTIKKSLSYIPIKSMSNIFKFSHPLGSITKENGTYIVDIGNKRIVTLIPQYFEMAEKCPEKFDIEIDGKLNSVDMASDFFVNDDFIVLRNEGVRVNVIGFKSIKTSDESNLKVTLSQLEKKFSVDNGNNIYRVEFYKNDKFCSMLMVRFK